jgi:predicted DNA-binding transcriptional regulator AlpA
VTTWATHHGSIKGKSHEFAELCGVKRARLYQLRDTDGAFPQPVARGVYLRVAAERYAANRASSRTA